MSGAQEIPEFAPHAIEVEQAILGWMLKDNRLIDTAAAELKALDFYDPLHQRMFDMIVYLITEGPITPLLLHQVMKTDAGMIELQGINYLHGLCMAAPALPNIPALAKMVRDMAERRQIIEVGQEMLAAAALAPHEAPSRTIASAATDRLLAIGAAGAAAPTSAYDTAMESLLEAERTMSGEPVPVVRTGFRQVDDEIGGFRGGDFIVVGGKSGMGKSALMGSISLNTSSAGIPTIVFSLEMTRRQWVERMVCDIDFSHCSGSDRPLWYSKIRNGKMTGLEFDRFGSAMRQLPDKKFLEIHDAKVLTAAQISARVRAFAAKHRNEDGTQKLGIVIIDYLQKVEPADDRENRERQVARIAMGLKNLAGIVNWPVVAGSQLNEDDKNRDNKRPRLGDLRESKVIGNEADLFVCPWREGYIVEQSKPMGARSGDSALDVWKEQMKQVRHKFELLFIKNRHGRTFDLEMFCEIGASAIRDWGPGTAGESTYAAQRDLLEEIG